MKVQVTSPRHKVPLFCGRAGGVLAMEIPHLRVGLMCGQRGEKGDVCNNMGRLPWYLPPFSRKITTNKPILFIYFRQFANIAIRLGVVSDYVIFT